MNLPSKQNRRAVVACPAYPRCGGCNMLHLPYEEQLRQKQEQVSQLLSPYCKVFPIEGMEEPWRYRNKVHAIFGEDKQRRIISGNYEEGSHRIIPVEDCLIENETADAIIRTIRKLAGSFHLQPYNEDTGRGLLRYCLIRTGKKTGQILVALVTAAPIFPSSSNFVKALRKEHPQITTIVQNINSRTDSMILGNREKTLYGPGYIEDELCGLRFRISARSFCQINPDQTEKLYRKAIELAQLTGKERVVDAYCGIGTIGLIAAKDAAQVIGIEINRDAIKDAITNAKRNNIRNAQFREADASDYMEAMAVQKEQIDVVFMDPPRSGSTTKFMNAMIKLRPKRIIYISCNPQTQARDLQYLTTHGYKAKAAHPYDMFPHTTNIENITKLERA